LHRIQFEGVIARLPAQGVLLSLKPNSETQAALKFAECVPPPLLAEEVRARHCAASDVELILREAKQWHVH
jgi:hypothetical protein